MNINIFIKRKERKNKNNVTFSYINRYFYERMLECGLKLQKNKSMSNSPI